MKTLSKMILTAAALALAAGAASAGPMSGSGRGPDAGATRGGPTQLHIDWTISHDVSSTSYIKSLLITILVPDTGEVNPDATILALPLPTVQMSGNPRAVENTEVLVVPGGNAVRWTFADDNLWSPGQTLVFGFDASFNGSTDYLIGEDYTFTNVPTPGAATLAGLGLLGFARRRR